jgi:hypothetical protein
MEVREIDIADAVSNGASCLRFEFQVNFCALKRVSRRADALATLLFFVLFCFLFFLAFNFTGAT